MQILEQTMYTKTGNNLTFHFIKQLFLLLLLALRAYAVLLRVQRPWYRVWWYVISRVHGINTLNEIVVAYSLSEVLYTDKLSKYHITLVSMIIL